MTERWETADEIAAARRRFEAAIPGWRAPLAHAVGVRDGGRVEFTRVNVGDGLFPAVVLATVCGHRGGSASYRVDAAALGRAIDLLAPAEACTALDHPNLGAWRWLHAGLADDDAVVGVFVADLDTPCDDPDVAALRERLLAGRTENPDGTTTLWRPVGPAEAALIAESGWRAFPARRPDQPIFYPVLNEAYAARIAAEWNVPASGAGYVTRFRIDTPFARRYPGRRAGGGDIEELWVPAEDLAEFNAHIVGPIEVIGEFRPDPPSS